MVAKVQHIKIDKLKFNPQEIAGLLNFDPIDPHSGTDLSILLNSFNLFSDGYWPRTKQWSVGVRFSQCDSKLNALQVLGVSLLIPYVKVIPSVRLDTDKCTINTKPFRIKHYDDSLMTYNFFVQEDCSVMLNRVIGGVSEYEDIGDFCTAMKYIQTNHYAYPNPNQQSFDFDGHNCYY